jgi:glucose/mannose transport system substrate-binding protein
MKQDLRTYGKRAMCTCLALLWGAQAAVAGELEVLHFWDVGADARAAALLKATLKAKGHSWQDFAVAGGGDGLAASMLRARVLSGNPPSAAQIKTPIVQQWAREGMLASIDDVAKSEKWDTLLPKAVSDAMKYKGSYVAVPINVHRVNWLWINADLLARSGTQAPKNWDEFFVTAEAMRRAGFVAVAHGGQPWQDLMMFASVALGVGGADFYRKAFVTLDPAVLASPTMEIALRTFRRIKPYTDGYSSGRDWIVASATLTRGEAGMQLMGDWAKPVFAAAQRTSGLTYLCVPAPGLAHAFSFTIDSFALFKVTGAAKVQAQKDFASALLSPAIQQEFNLGKGSIPVRLGTNLDKFDHCGQQAGAAFKAADHANTLVPDIAMVTPPAVEAAIRAVISDFWNDDRITSESAMSRLVAAAKLR